MQKLAFELQVRGTMLWLFMLRSSDEKLKSA